MIAKIPHYNYRTYNLADRSQFLRVISMPLSNEGEYDQARTLEWAASEDEKKTMTVALVSTKAVRAFGGIEFIDEDGCGPGVRLRERSKEKSRT
jgi:hypothetical protein